MGSLSFHDDRIGKWESLLISEIGLAFFVTDSPTTHASLLSPVPPDVPNATIVDARDRRIAARNPS